MFSFVNGPAHGVTLNLRRAPKLLRVVDNGQDFDALDQLDDEPRDDEIVHVYHRIGEKPFQGIMCMRGHGCQVFVGPVRYRYFERQPDAGITRDTGAWRNWCVELEREASGCGLPDPRLMTGEDSLV